MKGFFLCGLLVGPMCFSQDFSSDSATVQQIESINFTQRLPVTKEVVSVSKDLDFKNLGQDLPVLLKNQTSVVTTSDAGNGVGYTGFRIRGVGGTSINVMMNGVPYNDSESVFGYDRDDCDGSCYDKYSRDHDESKTRV